MPTFLSLPSSSRIPAILGTAIMCSIAGLSPALSETRIETVLGTVTKVDTLTSTYTVKTPKDERICEIRDVPIYSEGQKSDELGSMIIGGLLGSAVGNKLSDNNGAGAAGAVAGALLGRSQANKNAKSTLFYCSICLNFCLCGGSVQTGGSRSSNRNSSSSSISGNNISSSCK